MYIRKGVLIAFVVLSILGAYLVDRRAEMTLAQSECVGPEAVREMKPNAMYEDWGKYTPPIIHKGGSD